MINRIYKYFRLCISLSVLFGALSGCNKNDSDQLRSIIIDVQTSDDLERIGFRLGGETLGLNPEDPFDSITKISVGHYRREINEVKARAILIKGEFKSNTTNTPSEVIFTITDSKTNKILGNGEKWLRAPHDIFEFKYYTEL